MRAGWWHSGVMTGRPRIDLAVQAALAFALSVALFLLVALGSPLRDSVVVVLAVGALCLSTVVQAARRWGPLYAVPLAIAAGLGFDWFYIPPLHELGAALWQNALVVAIYLAMGVLIGILVVGSQRRAEASERSRTRLEGEQAALRRVATLVARGAAPDEVFAAVAEEVGILLGADGSRVVRYDGDDALTPVGGWGAPEFDPREGRPHSGVSAPITVQGRLWGAVVVWHVRAEALPDTAEARLADFTELIATAVSNSASRDELARLAEEQAALRRVATLMAQDTPPRELFGAVAREAGTLLGADFSGMLRCEDDAHVTAVAGWAAAGEHPPIPARFPTEPGDPMALLARRRGPARIEDWAALPGPIAAVVRERLRVRCSVGSPIVVQGRLWGALAVHSQRSAPLPADTEARIAQFTDLIGTAIANAEARAEVARLAREQAALRRVATLVAEGASATAVFDAIAAEIKGVLNADHVALNRYEAGGGVTVVAYRGPDTSHMPLGTRLSLDGESATAIVRRTGRAARSPTVWFPCCGRAFPAGSTGSWCAARSA